MEYLLFNLYGDIPLLRLLFSWFFLNLNASIRSILSIRWNLYFPVFIFIFRRRRHHCWHWRRRLRASCSFSFMSELFASLMIWQSILSYLFRKWYHSNYLRPSEWTEYGNFVFVYPDSVPTTHTQTLVSKCKISFSVDLVFGLINTSIDSHHYVPAKWLHTHTHTSTPTPAIKHIKNYCVRHNSHEMSCNKISGIGYRSLCC